MIPKTMIPLFIKLLEAKDVKAMYELTQHGTGVSYKEILIEIEEDK